MRILGFSPAILGPALLALTVAACGNPAEPEIAAPLTASEMTGGEQAFIDQATRISDSIGGCVREPNAARESRIVHLENGTIIMVSCSQGAYSFSDRLFSLREGEPPELLSLPDYDASGWIASDQASMAELDAGTGTLTTMRKSAGNGACGSEGRLQWDGVRFVLQELRWQACDDPNAAGPPFPAVWPTMPAVNAEPGDASPAP